MKQLFTSSTWAWYAILRFLLAIIVLFTHISWFIHTPLTSKIGQLGGVAAVIGFLLISGLSVGYSYHRQPDGFLTRRFLRIYPLYSFCVGLTLFLMLILPSPLELPHRVMAASGWKTGVSNFLFLQGFVSIAIPYNEPLWTISIEVFLYLLTPLLARLPHHIVIFLIVLSMLLFMMASPKSTILFGYTAARFAWPWLIGFLFTVKQQPIWAIFLSVVGILLVFFSESTPEPLSWITYIVTVLVGFFVCHISLRKTQQTVFNWLGEMSYPLYIFHVPLAMIYFYFAGEQSVWSFIIFIFVMIIALNYIVDGWLKTVFWKPLVKVITKVANHIPIKV